MREKAEHKLRVWLLPMVVFMLCLLWNGAAFAEGTVELHYSGMLDYDKANQAVTLVNQERAAAGLSKLTQTGDIQQMAMIRAMETALYFSHTRPDGNRGLDIMGTTGTRAENIGMGYTSASGAMTGWMNSSGHKANILNASVTQIGVGCFYANGTWYWVQLFRSGSGGSGSVLTGTANNAIAVKALPSILDLYVQATGTSFSENAVIELTAGSGRAVIAYNRNTAVTVSRKYIQLYATSPGLVWGSDGSFTITKSSSSVGATLYGKSCGSGRTLTLTCGTRSFTTLVSIAHNPESGSSCEKDLKCTVCGTVVEAKSGHSVGTNVSCTEYTACTKCGQLVIPPVGHSAGTKVSCTEYTACTRCGQLVIPPVGHQPAGAATCTSDSLCKNCYVVLEEAYGHNFTGGTCRSFSTCTRCGQSSYSYGNHVWSDWVYSSGGTYMTRKCSVCNATERKKVTNADMKTTSVKVSRVEITGNTSVLAGKKITLTASVSPSNAANRAVTWSSSNSKYAAVSANGVVTAKAAGAGKTVTITAKAKDGSGKKAAFQVKIKGAVTKITLKGSKTLKAGKKTTIKATVKVGKGGSKAVTWSSSNKKYATVSSKGVVKAKAAGKGRTVTITARAKDGSGKKASIKIKIK